MTCDKHVDTERETTLWGKVDRKRERDMQSAQGKRRKMACSIGNEMSRMADIERGRVIDDGK